MKVKIWGVFISLALFVIGVLGAVSVYLTRNSSIYSRDYYLTGFKHDSDLYQTNQFDASFVASAVDNYAIYETGGQDPATNDINNYEFYGDVESYDYAPKTKFNLELWENDANLFQWVIKSKMDLKNLKVAVTNQEELSAAGISIRYGFVDFAYAHQDTNNMSAIENAVSGYYLVPDIFSERKVQEKLVTDKVAPIYFYVQTNEATEVGSYEINLTLTNDEGVAIDATSVGVDVSNNYQLATNWSDVNIFNGLDNISYYYNISKNEVPADFKDWFQNVYLKNSNDSNKSLYNELAFFEYNNEKYWKTMNDEMANMVEQQWAFLAIGDNAEVRDISLIQFDEENESKDQWNVMNRAITPFTFILEDGNDKKLSEKLTKDLPEDEFMSLFKDKIRLGKYSWSSFDLYMKSFAEAGFKKLQLSGIQGDWGPTTLTSMYSYANKAFVPSYSGPEKAQGKLLLNLWLDEFKKHVDQVRAGSDETLKAAYNEVKIYYYDDEKSWGTVKMDNNILKAFDPKHEYIHYAIADWENDVVGYEDVVDTTDYAEYAWIYNYDFYNEDNENYMNFVNKRNKLGLRTGWYSLGCNETNNFVGADIGIGDYSLFALSLTNSPLYCNYSNNEWYRKNPNWSSNFINCRPGETMYAYPELNGMNEYQKIHAVQDDHSLVQAKQIVSLRSLELNVGTKYTNKIKTLEDTIDDETTYLKNNISTSNKISNTSSAEKFNLNYTSKTFTGVASGYKDQLSILIDRLSNKDVRDEITAVKNIRNLIDLVGSTK
jgi:hypothetical protein